MSETRAEDHKEPPYLLIAVVLLTLTIGSFFISEQFESRLLTVLLVMCIATAKTTLVAGFFMHVKFEGAWLYALTIPAVILAAVLVSALLPDVAFLVR